MNPKIFSKYGNLWVALDHTLDKVIASGTDLKKVDKEAEVLTKSPDNYTLVHISDPTHTYSP